jgi:hypothetical protein
MKERALTVETIIKEDSNRSKDNSSNAREEQASTHIDLTPLLSKGYNNLG